MPRVKAVQPARYDIFILVKHISSSINNGSKLLIDTIGEPTDILNLLHGIVSTAEITSGGLLTGFLNTHRVIHTDSAVETGNVRGLVLPER